MVLGFFRSIASVTAGTRTVLAQGDAKYKNYA